MATKQISAINVKRDEKEPEAVELIARHIIQVSEAFQSIQKSPLTERAILILIKDSIPGPGPSLNDIRLVLRHAATLKETFIKKLPKEGK